MSYATQIEDIKHRRPFTDRQYGARREGIFYVLTHYGSVICMINMVDYDVRFTFEYVNYSHTTKLFINRIFSALSPKVSESAVHNMLTDLHNYVGQRYGNWQAVPADDAKRLHRLINRWQGYLKTEN